MMESDNHLVNLRLESHLVSELRELLREVPIGAQFAVSSSADICSSLELFLPKLLRNQHKEWVRESLDGIFVARALKTGPAAAQLAGTCILISDQTVTPFLIDLEVSPTIDSVVAFRVLLGEAGGGPLGISGPVCNSGEAKRLLATLISRLDSITWSYKIASP